jgi:hypothetical protein
MRVLLAQIDVIQPRLFKDNIRVLFVQANLAKCCVPATLPPFTELPNTALSLDTDERTAPRGKGAGFSASELTAYRAFQTWPGHPTGAATCLEARVTRFSGVLSGPSASDGESQILCRPSPFLHTNAGKVLSAASPLNHQDLRASASPTVCQDQCQILTPLACAA